MRTLLLMTLGILAFSQPGVEAQDSVNEIAVEDFFRGGEIADATLSPDGSLVAYRKGREIMAGNPDMGYHVVMAFDHTVAISDVQWSGPEQLLMSTSATLLGDSYFWVLDLNVGKNSVKPLKKHRFNTPGYVLDTLHDDPSALLLVRHSQGEKGLKSNVFRINPRKKLKFQTGKVNRLNKKFTAARYFVLDSKARPTIAVSRINRKPQLFRQNVNRKDWKKIWSGEEDITFIPYSISPDNQTLYAISNATTDRAAAVSFDLNSGRISQVIFEHDSVDVKGLLTDPVSGKVQAVRHLEGGLLHYEFLDDTAKDQIDWMKKDIGSDSIFVVDRSDDLKTYLIAAVSTTQPGVYYRCEDTARRCDKIAATMPWLSDISLSPTTVYTTQSSDGYNVQSLLTMPVSGSSNVPLIVMPHGGPIGVQDNRQFSGDVQWLAFNGYAVLQVNYRGSAGFGKTFKSAGLQQWGRGIEDDIEASLDNALAKNPTIDAKRVGIFGGSYGGYSAMQSIVRSPQRYRCAASFAGVSDLTLLFNTSYVKRNQRAKNLLVEMIGDPATNRAKLMEYSPVYNYKKLVRPIFLSHGNDDEIVDVEHSWRINKLLKLAKMPVELHVLNGVGHGFTELSQINEFYTPLMAFLDLHLKNEP